MVETNHSSHLSQPPPPAPPLPPPRSSVLQRFIAPLSFGRPQKSHDARGAQPSSASPKDISRREQPYRPPPPRTALFRTDISIAAIDVNQDRTHAVLAGRDILKTVKVQDKTVIEDLNIRGLVSNYISAQQLKPEDVHKRREYLPAKDVRWSHNTYSHVIATAAQNGRIALYDVSTLGRSRVELAWLYQHTGEVNKIDFDPFSGYMLLSGSQDKFCKSWDIRDPRKPAGLFQYHIRAPVRDVRWAPTDAWVFALCTEGGVVQKWDVRNTHQPQMSISAHEKSCYTIAWHPDGKHLASGGFDKHLRVWDLSGENRRQKPVLQLRGPHGIMNLAWRPPCWSAEFARAGNWQSTQIATSYTEDDHRVHIWDLRRPLIPFRELNQYDTRPRDLLWASKDLLWTAGGNGRSGIFAQNDVTYASNIEDTLPPGATTWSGDRSFYAVLEDRSARRDEITFDPAAAFLNVPQDRLSGVEDGATSRSLTDDEGSDLGLLEYSRRQSKAGSTRSVKSQADTPPNHEDELHVLPLDRAIAGKRDLFINGQVGAMSSLPGIYSPLLVVKFVAQNYAKVLTTVERTAAPDQLLSRLEDAFLHNARVCDVVFMHRTAQTWRILVAVVIPELKEWADKNKMQRLKERNQAQLRKEEEKEYQRTQIQLMSSPFVKSMNGGRSPAKPEKLMTTLFRGVVDSERAASDNASTSNMTTPIARPFPSPNVSSKKDGSTWFTLDDAIEPIQPLPPSLANAHLTAAAASRVLLDNTNELPDSPIPSSEKLRSPPDKGESRKRSATESIAMHSENKSAIASPAVGQNVAPNHLRSPLTNINQEERRAALRDYKATSRQPFTLEARPAGAKSGREDRHDSSESFPMFSASSSSSARARSFGYSFGVANQSDVSRKDFEDWDDIHDDGYYDSASKSTGVEESNSSRSGTTDSKEYDTSQTIDFAMDDSPQMAFGLEKPSKLQPGPNKEQNSGQSVTRSKALYEKTGFPIIPQEELSPAQISQQDDVIHRHHLSQRFHHFNPFADEQAHESKIEQSSHFAVNVKNTTSDTESYQISDFRPIDIKLYQTDRPFALSAWAIISQVIAQDVQYGVNSAQLSTHLLSHIHPFFFNQSPQAQEHPATSGNSIPLSLADKLMSPKFSTRVIEGILASHLDYLQRLNLYLPAAHLRKFCVEQLGYNGLWEANSSSRDSKPAGDTLRTDPREMKSTCSNCKSTIASEATACRYCSEHRNPCPVCETSGALVDDICQSQASVLYAYCHACGHSAHLSCMSTWLSLPDTHGECPTPFCGCDCGPGLVRQKRITRQFNIREEDAEIRASSATSTHTLRKDPHKVQPSPAADKARDSLRRRSIPVERGTQSGDEDRGNTGSAWSKRSSRMSASRGLERSNSGSGSGSGTHTSSSFSRRVVRVVEPDK